MYKNLHRVGLLAIMVALGACSAHPPKSGRTFDPDTCDHNAGYEAGYNDGLEGRPMDTQFTHRCREDLREAAFKGYKSGYDVGKKEYAERMAEWRRQREEREREERAERDREISDSEGKGSGNTNINVNIGGIQTTGGTSGSNQSRAYWCQVEAFTSKFEAFGPTKLEAQRNVLAECQKRYHRMHCDEEDVVCERNQ